MLVDHRMVTPQYQVRRYSFLYLGGERHCESKVLTNTTKCPWPGLEPGPLDHAYLLMYLLCFGNVPSLF